MKKSPLLNSQRIHLFSLSLIYHYRPTSGTYIFISRPSSNISNLFIRMVMFVVKPFNRRIVLVPEHLRRHSKLQLPPIPPEANLIPTNIASLARYAFHFLGIRDFSDKHPNFLECAKRCRGTFMRETLIRSEIIVVVYSDHSSKVRRQWAISRYLSS
jgi:hypothetical protein